MLKFVNVWVTGQCCFICPYPMSNSRNVHVICHYEMSLSCYLSPYHIMRFPYVALAVRPNANEMYMQRK